MVRFYVACIGAARVSKRTVCSGPGVRLRAGNFRQRV